MSLLDALQSPQGLLGLSVLANSDRPAQGLLQGLARNQQFQQQGLQQQLAQAQILKAQQDAEERKRQQAQQAALSGQFSDFFGTRPTEQSGPQPQGLQGTSLLGGGTGALADNVVDADEMRGFAGLLMQSPQTMQEGIQLMNSIKETAQKPTTLMQNLQGAGYEPGTPEFQTAMLEQLAKPSGTTINVGAGPMATLDVPKPGGGVQKVTVRRDDPRVNELLAAGATESGATALSQVEVTKLGEIGARYSTLDRLATSFKPEFSSSVPGLQAAQNILGSKMDIGGSGEQSDWWRDYQSFRNEVRNSLFGGALTKTEADEFLKADITPAMDPKRVQSNLNRQIEIASKAVKRQAEPLAKAGKDTSQINTAIGADIVGRTFYQVGTKLTIKGKKYRVKSPGFDPELEEIK